jgi:hypothetical protein
VGLDAQGWFRSPALLALEADIAQEGIPGDTSSLQKKGEGEISDLAASRTGQPQEGPLAHGLRYRSAPPPQVLIPSSHPVGSPQDRARSTRDGTTPGVALSRPQAHATSTSRGFQGTFREAGQSILDAGADNRLVAGSSPLGPHHAVLHQSRVPRLRGIPSLHNRLVAGSSPPSPTTQSCANPEFPVSAEHPRFSAVWGAKLAQGTPPLGSDKAKPRSRSMIKKIRSSLGALLAEEKVNLPCPLTPEAPRRKCVRVPAPAPARLTMVNDLFLGELVGRQSAHHDGCGEADAMTIGATIYLVMLLVFGVMAAYELRSAMDGELAEKSAKGYGERRAHPTDPAKSP